MIILTSTATISHSKFHLFNEKTPDLCFLQCLQKWVSLKTSFQSRGTLNFHHRNMWDSKFLVKAVATFGPSCRVEGQDEEKGSNLMCFNGELVCSSGDSEEVDERERLRRLRISKANKGNTPWNKGRKHSPETLQLIRERTRLAMQNPKVRMKLANIGHAQSIETREKIAVGVRMGWQRRRKKLMLQETCLFDWQNLIAVAARNGLDDEEELQWDSYKILTEKLQQEWLNSIEERKTMPRAKGSKRAPKSLEQRRKIAEAITAKWADPEYRSKVCSSLAKYHGTPEGAERKARRKPSSESRSPRTPKTKASEAERSSENAIKARPQQPKLKKRNTPKYKDPLANYKLEMLKSIRAQRVATETKKIEALERAKLLIAEAEKAAKALEVAATRSTVAQASLVETRKLIAEAIQSIESIENRELTSEGVGVDVAPVDQKYVAEKVEFPKDDASKLYQNNMNGISSIQSSEGYNPDFNLYKLTTLDKIDTDYQIPSRLSKYELPTLDVEKFIGNSSSAELMDQQHPAPNGATRLNGTPSTNGHPSLASPAEKTTAKKWLRGRLVEVVKGD